MTDSQENIAYTGWAILSLMGHRQRVGIVGEAEMYGGKLLRIDVPSGEEMITEYYGTASIYSLEPINEDVAKKHISHDFRPVNPLSYREPTEEEIKAEAERRARNQLSYQAIENDDDLPF